MLRAKRRLWAWTRLVIGLSILGVLVWRLGTRPFLDAVQRIDLWSLAAAVALAVPTTLCCSWRWKIVSRGLGSDLPLRTAVAAYYRSQFLNLVLPGGVLGDVHRAVRRGRDVGDVRHGLRVVAWERTAGQAVQVVLTLLVLLVLPSPVRSSMPWIAALAVAVVVCAVQLGRRVPRRGPSALVRASRALGEDLRYVLLARRVWPGVALTSAVALAGHTATFLVAARTAGSTGSVVRMLPLALLVLLAMSVPTNVAGWGPREGVAAWVFALAGLGAAQGLATTVVYGAMALVATLPGAVVLLATAVRGQGADAEPPDVLEVEPVRPAGGLGGEVTSVRR
jgi:glycosyltransferase 2 family protein